MKEMISGADRGMGATVIYELSTSWKDLQKESEK